MAIADRRDMSSLCAEVYNACNYTMRSSLEEQIVPIQAEGISDLFGYASSLEILLCIFIQCQSRSVPL